MENYGVFCINDFSKSILQPVDRRIVSLISFMYGIAIQIYIAEHA